MVMSNSQIWPPWVLEDYSRQGSAWPLPDPGFSTFQKVTHFDDLTFLSTGLTRFPLEGYKERCNTQTVIGSLNAENPLVLETPIYISGMSYGALSANAKTALGKGAAMVGTASCTGDGGMLQSERDVSDKFDLPSTAQQVRIQPSSFTPSAAVEIVVGQGAKPGTGGLLMGVKVLDDVADMRAFPVVSTNAVQPATPIGWALMTCAVKIEQLRGSYRLACAIHVKLGACRVDDDVKLAAKAGADAIVVDSMVAGTGASSEVLIEHSGIPTVPAIVMAREALRELGLYGKVSFDCLRWHPPRCRCRKGIGPWSRRCCHRYWRPRRSQANRIFPSRISSMKWACPPGNVTIATPASAPWVSQPRTRS